MEVRGVVLGGRGDSQRVAASSPYLVAGVERGAHLRRQVHGGEIVDDHAGDIQREHLRRGALLLGSGAAGQEISNGRTNRASGHDVAASEGRDRRAGEVRLPYGVHVVIGDDGATSPTTTSRTRRRHPLARQLILLVALKLANGREDIDHEARGRGVGCQVPESGERAGERLEAYT